MTGRLFVDTNILIYALDPADPGKRSVSADLLRRTISSHTLTLSPQSLNECYRVLTGRRKLIPVGDARSYVRTLAPWAIAPLDAATTERAWAVQDRAKLSWWDSLMVAAALGSYFTTKRSVHHSNDFNFHPINEVAWLFIGIFATMVPALQYLELNAKALPLSTEMHFFWLTGALSGVLDNAPTYLAFLAAAFGRYGLSVDSPADMQTFIAEHDHYLIAISIGAVFFGAMTYIGNGPNFMVKAISEHQKVETPSFLAYIVRFALPVLVPFFFLVGILFFSRWRIF